jgi:DNA-binding NarL/FixJ family response regulator
VLTARALPRVLVVDDDPGFRRVARRVLDDAALDVVAEAEDIVTARECEARQRPDAVLLDVNLPDGCGMALARELLGRRPELRVVLTSSDAGAGPAPGTLAGVAFVPKTDLARVDLAACFRY